jgi:hypothetical protein
MQDIDIVCDVVGIYCAYCGLGRVRSLCYGSKTIPACGVPLPEYALTPRTRLKLLGVIGFLHHTQKKTYVCHGGF